ncbi:MAG: hypothetical protein HRT88_17145, partial [Lentisphaeraceae bacterium]|nr:hypothetical protein [Lentisphaeraceae bacterium]
MKWSEAAEKALQEFLEKYRVQFETEDINAEVLIDDVRCDLHEELAVLGVAVVTVDHVERVIQQSHFKLKLEEELKDTANEELESTCDNKFCFSGRKSFMYMFFTFFLPILAVIIELAVHPFGESFFDPLPNWWHVILCLMAPVSNLCMYVNLKEKKGLSQKLLVFNSMGIACGLYYGIYFIPLAPLSLLGILLFGAGLLSLSPVLALWGACTLRRRYKQGYGFQPSGCTRVLSYLLILGLILLGANIPDVISEIGLSQYVNAKTAEEKSEAISFLRSWGSPSRILYKKGMAYRSDISSLVASRKMGDLPDWVSLEDDEVDKLYYQISGQAPFKDKHFYGPFARRGGYDRWDDELGEQGILHLRKNLSLFSSRFDSSIDGDAALAYSEWTLEFLNTGYRNEEARMEVLLPKGAVVSRLTLWVDGEEREAAFAKNSKVKGAYQSVVSRNRDPVLVTWSGRDRVFVQCFPVMPNKKMKIRLGISSALSLEEKLSSSTMYFPKILERNFNIEDDFVHSVWLESKCKITSPQKLDLVSENFENELYAARGKVRHSYMNNKFKTLVARGEGYIFWSEDKNDVESAIISSITEVRPYAYEKVRILIDGSVSMHEYQDGLKELFPMLLAKAHIELYIAGDSLIQIKSMADVEDYEFIGGMDNIPALKEMIEKSNGERDSVIWLHGPQPYLLSSTSVIEQFSARRNLPDIYFYQFGQGRNLILNELKEHASFFSLTDGDENVLATRLKKFVGNEYIQRFSYKRIARSDVFDSTQKTYDHLSGLHVFNEIQQIYYSGKKYKYDDLAS